MRLDRDRVWLLLEDLGFDLDVDDYRGELEHVSDAIVEEASPDKVDRLVREATERIWSEELRKQVAAELTQLRAETRARLAVVEAAQAQLDLPARKNPVARGLVHRAAILLVEDSDRAVLRLARLEERLREAPAAEHRGLALPVAAAVAGAPGIERAEADEAAFRFLESFPDDWEHRPAAADQAAHWLARSLATDERRAVMRAALAELREAAGEDFPLLAAALAALLAEPVPGDPAEDDLWVNLSIGLVQRTMGLEPDELDS